MEPAKTQVIGKTHYSFITICGDIQYPDLSFSRIISGALEKKRGGIGTAAQIG